MSESDDAKGVDKPFTTKGQQRKPNSPGGWELESSFDTVTSLEELIFRPPFKETSGREGGSATLGVRIPSWLERKVIHLLEIKGSPYQIKSDVARDAVYLGLRILNMRYKPTTDWAVESKMADAIDKVNLINRIRGQVESFTKPELDLWESGDEQQAIDGMEMFVSAAMEIEDEWQRDKTLKLLKGVRQLQPIIDGCSVQIRDAIRNAGRK